MLDAMRAGDCEYGIASMADDLDGLTPFSPLPHYFDATAVGVGRHARQPESAQRLVDWLLRHRQTVLLTQESPPSAGTVGWYDQEARLLAERAGYR